MANVSIFKSLVGWLLPRTDTFNEAGGKAYTLEPKQALAQYAATGCFNSTFYASAEEQLEKVLALCKTLDPAFIARTAVYARQRGRMKDMPALLCAALSVNDNDCFNKTFQKVIDDGKMLRNFVQIMRSGTLGRKSLGSRPKRLVRNWLDAKSDEALFRASVGNAPSLADIVKMVHPKPATPARAALYGYLLGKEHDVNNLPALVADYEAYKADNTKPVPNVPFQMLTALNLGMHEWAEVARNAGWQMTRMNLNTFARHGVFNVPGLSALIADKIRDKELIAKAKVFPYQLLTAYHMTDGSVPNEVREALQDAMEIAIDNVPVINGKVYVCVDVSGSMSSPVTGHRQGATTAVRCVDVAALMAAAILRKNPNAEIIPFDFDTRTVAINPRDSVMTNAGKLAALCGGGTNVSAPLAMLNKRQAAGDLVLYVSDNESWVDRWYANGTVTMREWNAFKQRNPAAKLVCIDIQPYGTTQAKEREDVLNVGGFSDAVFDVVAEFANNTLRPDHWVGVIDSVQLD